MPRADYQPVIGLEVHAQLLTHSKLFSGASTDFGAEPNANTTAYCVALPGLLPVLNQQVVTLAIRTGVALNCTVNEVSEWSRKHYFYPDLPKGYQITQFEKPICEWGHLDIGDTSGSPGKRIVIRRIHIEEDAGKLIHDAADGLSLVDLNRAGTPLLEIVSEPDLRSADEAVEYLKNLREVLMAIGVNDGNLEQGSFRCDANVSIMKHGSTVLGTRCELKNLNSFRFIKAAIEVEIERHVEILDAGGAIEQETRLYDTQRNETRSMRSKEDAHDYRYFPEPDLPLLKVTAAQIEEARAALPELPKVKRRRYVEQLKLPEYDAGVLTADPHMAQLFDACVSAGAEAKKTSNWFMGELARLLNDKGLHANQVKFTPAQFVALLKAVDDGVVSSSAAKEVFIAMFESGEDPIQLIDARGLRQVSDTGALEAAVDAVLAAAPANVASFRAGKTQLLSSFVGQVMKSLKGKGTPKLINELLLKKLNG